MINSMRRYWPSEKSNNAIKAVPSSSIFIADLDGNHTHRMIQKNPLHYKLPSEGSHPTC